MKIKTLSTSLTLMAALAASSHAANKKEERPNILFIAIDDLRPELGCYGAKDIKSPNIDKLASQGVVFTRAYCQVPVCGPSRSSMLSGIRPDEKTCKIWAVDQFAPHVVTLPQAFRESGYYTISNSKIFHGPEQAADRSWSETPTGHSSHQDTLDPASKNYMKGKRGPFFEAPDVPDEAYVDGQTCEKSITDLKRLSKMNQPFFLGVGFIRPHLPFYAPKKYWDLYDRDKIAIANNPYTPKNAPSSLRGGGEVGSYHDRGIKYNSEEFHKIARHGYYACVSYADALVGKLLTTLDELGLRENTIVVIWGDHGWNLGEHNFWGKHNLVHNSTHAPLIISAPGFKRNIRSDDLVEFIDIYPTLCELAGIKLPNHLDGKSMVPLMNDPTQQWKSNAYTRYGDGYTVTTRNYTYTEYGHNEQRMLFDRTKDPEENENVVADPHYAETVREMRKFLHPEGSEKNVVEVDGMRFIDADESNTVAVNAPEAAFSTPAAKSGALWSKRPGIGLDIYDKKEIYERISGDPPMLKTTIRDLEPGTEVGVYVGFISNPSQSWRVRAGLKADTMGTYTPTSPFGYIKDMGLIGPKAVAHQYLGLIGDTTVPPDGCLDVFIAHGNGGGSVQRTMYEGVTIGPPTGKAAAPAFTSAPVKKGEERCQKKGVSPIF